MLGLAEYGWSINWTCPRSNLTRMTALVPRISPRHPVFRDTAAIWLAAAAVLVYLGVPATNAALFASAIVLQAALGALVIVQLIRGLSSSLLLLSGPGLILGSALAFTVFQVVGRGITGIAVSVALGFLSIFGLTRRTSKPDIEESRLGTVSQLTGMAL
ncbi:MAG: hypothetical protein EB145_18630, partial [Proteobacteria bacterium]|nr:hypothetical protein [Pseudomonadota bacterium]